MRAMYSGALAAAACLAFAAFAAEPSKGTATGETDEELREAPAPTAPSTQPQAPGARQPETGLKAPVGRYSIDAQLVDREANALRASAKVKVAVSGFKLTDPDKAGLKPMAGQGHLHYRVDGGPVIATTADQLSFHGLAKGEHSFEVTGAGNDHGPLTPTQRLMVTIP